MEIVWRYLYFNKLVHMMDLINVEFDVQRHHFVLVDHLYDLPIKQM